MDSALIEWDVATWQDVDRAIDAFDGGRDVYLRLRGPMRQQRRNIEQALTSLCPGIKVVDVRDADLGLFHPVGTAGGGDLSGDREPRPPLPTDRTGAARKHLTGE